MLKKAEKFLPGFLRKKAEQRARGGVGPGAGRDTEAGLQPFPEAVLELALGAGSLAALPQGDTELTLTSLHLPQTESGCGGQETPSSPRPSPPFLLASAR